MMDLLSSPSQSAFQKLLAKVNSYKPKSDGKDADGNVVTHADEIYLKICCQLALRSVSLGNFGIGVVIVDPMNKLKPHLQNATVSLGGSAIMILITPLLLKILLGLDLIKSSIRGILDKEKMVSLTCVLTGTAKW
jgi:hypothetical protein